MKKQARRLTLNRETLLRLEEAPLRRLVAGRAVISPETREPACYSPFCGPTYWETCDTVITG